MSEAQSTFFEFDENNELHRKAQDYIETMDRDKFPTLGDLMVTAIVDYFDRYYAQQNGETLISDTDPQSIENMIEAACERALEKKLPEILAPMLNNLQTAEGTGDEEAQLEAEEQSEALDLGAVEKDINWGFLGG